MHQPVLLDEVLEYLDIKPGEVVVDGTLGFGGHSLQMLKKIGNSGKLIGIEQDTEVIEMVSENLSGKNIFLVNANFERFGEILQGLKVKKVDKILFDLGVSSFHFDKSGRGFSFQKDEPLDMRLSDQVQTTAADLVNALSRKELADLIYDLGDETMSRQIAAAIVENRRKAKIVSTSQLTSIIESAVPRRGKINPSTKTFQALRIAVNNELGVLLSVLPQAIDSLKKGGRIAVISFHSGEDRIVKNFLKTQKNEKRIEILTKKPVMAACREINDNPRSRSARLRVAQKI